MELNAQNVGQLRRKRLKMSKGDEVDKDFKSKFLSDAEAVKEAKAVAFEKNNLKEAEQLIKKNSGSVQTGNPEEDRLFADMAGREGKERVELLIKYGADLTARGLDDGTPLHQAAWFGQPENARLLIEAGAPLDIFDSVHQSSPIGWAVHGSRYSGGADERQEKYIDLVQMLLQAGSKLYYPDKPRNKAYYLRLLKDASPEVKELLHKAG